MKLLCLLSGGIDSAVAVRMMQDRGAETIPVFFDVSGTPDDGLMERMKSVASSLGFTEVLVVPHRKSMDALAAENAHLACVLCKRMMMRAASMLAEEMGADALVTGDSLGQVASQTPSNLRAETAAASVPILRPLIGFNKDETVKLARKIGTFEPSTAKAGGCPFVPRHPATRSDLRELERAESAVDSDALARSATTAAYRLTIGESL